MKLPERFQFSQQSLQDFQDCPRRFQLRYLKKMGWPAAVAKMPEDWERQMRMGDAFHRLAHRHLLGMSVDHLARASGDKCLVQWWENFLSYRPCDLPGQRHPEVELVAGMGGYHLLAKYDLLVVEPGQRLTILDWKTGKPADKVRLRSRMQTIVYRWVLAEAGWQFNDREPVLPEQVEMIYWFAVDPEQLIRLPYDPTQHEAAGRLLMGLIADIKDRGEADFEQTADCGLCAYCAYNSYCQRKGAPADVEEPTFQEDWQELEGWDQEPEQVGEAEY